MLVRQDVVARRDEGRKRPGASRRPPGRSGRPPPAGGALCVAASRPRPRRCARGGARRWAARSSPRPPCTRSCSSPRAGARRRGTARQPPGRCRRTRRAGRGVVPGAHDGVVQLQTGRQRVRGGGHDILNQAVRVNDARLVHDVLAARAGVAADAHGEVGAHVFLGAAQFLVLEREPSRRRAGGRAASAPRGARPVARKRGRGGVGNRKGDDGHGGKPRGRGRDARGRVGFRPSWSSRQTKTVSPSERRRARKRIVPARTAKAVFGSSVARAPHTEARTRGESRPSRGARIARGRSLRTSRRGSSHADSVRARTAPSGSRSETRRRSA